jgi:hypothetical protein
VFGSRSHHFEAHHECADHSKHVFPRELLLAKRTQSPWVQRSVLTYSNTIHGAQSFAGGSNSFRVAVAALHHKICARRPVEDEGQPGQAPPGYENGTRTWANKLQDVCIWLGKYWRTRNSYAHVAPRSNSMVPSSGLLPTRLEYLPLEHIDDPTDVGWLMGPKHLQALL